MAIPAELSLPRTGDEARLVETPFHGGRPIRIGVLVSGKGRGSNMAALVDSCRAGRISGSVVLVASTSPDAPALARAGAAGVETAALVRMPGVEDSELDSALVDLFESRQVDLICLAGFMRRAGPCLLDRFRWRLMNIHPSLIPAFAGHGMYGMNVHRAVLAYGVKLSGVTVQFVTADYDAGPIILQRAVPVEEGDSPESLAERILPVEHAAYSEAVRLFAEGRLSVADGRRTVIAPDGP